MTGVVLYGPPAAGKDTVTAALAAADPAFQLATKLKLGSGRPTGYRFVTAEELHALRAAGRLVVETRRYGNVYAIDHQDLAAMHTAGRIPVVHIGNRADLRTLTRNAPGPWLRVLLWVPRDVCGERSRLRNDADTDQRLRAWDETAADLLAADATGEFDLVVRTDKTTPSDTAGLVARAAALLAPGEPAISTSVLTRAQILDAVDLPAVRSPRRNGLGETTSQTDRR